MSNAYTTMIHTLRDQYNDFADLTDWGFTTHLSIAGMGESTFVTVYRDGQVMLTFDDVGAFCSWADNTDNLEELAASSITGHPLMIETN